MYNLLVLEKLCTYNPAASYYAYIPYCSWRRRSILADSRHQYEQFRLRIWRKISAIIRYKLNQLSE